ncbi:FKBP-type peptidyl-prolyl cis-trans isomerase [Nannocystis sp. SCPEA4]|uniref:FKBP-type peptidyl-prolyl cis-trans isomerase n=1 Tax=Nannocystis sp. SCPEA4 TaxID=2996787 RepID=UPI00226F027B|nr:FKBP-type peptidyl-prolyl cis-trans isomerase [Nannocystis sp. SCPEA4]MCY1060843.1 FKBP-type peptidyl-prolyl cis-trans isomerase [Nannocystis sp. SCPEA4]
MKFRAPFALLLPVVLAACTGGEAPKTDTTKTEPAKAEPAKAEVKAEPAKAEAPPLPLEPTDAIKYEPPFDGKPLSSNKTASGLTIEDFVIGEGAEAVKGGEVEVHYTGFLTDGVVFDTSKKRNRPFTFSLGEGRVIKGWDEGVVGMKVGGKRRLIVPAALGYGDRRAGKIPPGATLVFTIELLSFTPPPPPPQPLTAFEGKPVGTKTIEGVKITDFKLGEGAEAKTGDTVAVHYRGTLKDGTEFDSSLARKPISFPLGQGRVIKGWDLGIAGMKVGGLRKLEIPAKLAYGERAKGKIPANSDLTFTVELMSVKPAPTPPAGATAPGAAPGQPATPGAAQPAGGAAQPAAGGASTPAKPAEKPAEKKAG